MMIIILALCLFSAVCAPLQAADVVIVKRGATKLALDLSGLTHSEGVSLQFRNTLVGDLERSGWFTVAGEGAAIAISGPCYESGETLTVKCEVRSTATSKKYLSRKFKSTTSEARRLAHLVADEIVWAIKGRRGIASTRIVMIGARSGRKDLYICDVDGKGFRRLTKDGLPCVSPNWGPDAQTLVYTSFHKGYPDVYRIDLAENRRTRISGYPGLNAGADVSPDGKSIAVTLSKDGNPELYVKRLRTSRLTRLTNTPRAAEASPSWSPDGKTIVFVSDRPGAPQLYTVPANGGKQTRITYHGGQNVAPDWGPDGRIVFSSRRDGRYHICILDMETGDEQQLTRDFADHEDPSWAPDARHIVCSQTAGYESALYILDTMGDPPVRLTTIAGDWYSPAWSQR